MILLRLERKSSSISEKQWFKPETQTVLDFQRITQSAYFVSINDKSPHKP
ncbi:MAG: hypothetical protein AB7P01_09760 [Bacteroidia bacterium]